MYDHLQTRHVANYHRAHPYPLLSATQNGECWDEFDGCHQFNQDFDDYGYAYIYPYKKGHTYELPHNSAVGKSTGLWGAVLVVLACFACSTGTWEW